MGMNFIVTFGFQLWRNSFLPSLFPESLWIERNLLTGPPSSLNSFSSRVPFPSLSFSLHIALTFQPCTSLAPGLPSLALSLFCLPLFYSSLVPPPLLSWPSSVCWPGLVYYFLSLQWTLADASDCTLPHSTIKTLPLSIPWSIHVLTSYIWLSSLNLHALYGIRHRRVLGTTWKKFPCLSSAGVKLLYCPARPPLEGDVCRILMPPTCLLH